MSLGQVGGFAELEYDGVPGLVDAGGSGLASARWRATRFRSGARHRSRLQTRQNPYSVVRRPRISAEFLGEPDEKALRPADVAEPIRVFVLDYFTADKLSAVLAEPGERPVDVVHCEHDA